MDISPFARQLFVASSPQLAALSTGGIIGYTTVLLQQFKSNDSIIQVDMDTATWIASVHGLAGVPSVLMPSIMQLRGRKFAFIISCLLIIAGWTTAYFATSVRSVILAECVHGLGLKSILVVSFLTISEMVDPIYRNISLLFYGVNQILGITCTHVLARYLHWKTIALIMGIPVVFAFIISCFWPESPIWLAYRGKFDECESAFYWLRGNDENSEKELRELINNYKRNLKRRDSYNNCEEKRHPIRKIWLQIISKGFYLPSLHIFVLISAYYWSGGVALIVYGMDMINQATRSDNAAFIGILSFDTVTIFGSALSWFFLKYFNNKPVLILSGIGAAIFLLCASTVSYLQTIETLSKESLLCLYSIVGYMISISLGIFTLSFSISAELMPMKHKGLSGGMYVIYVCLLHTSSIKMAPYLFAYMNLSGTFALYAGILLVCLLCIWKFVPETKNRTLQEIENYYVDGSFIRRNVKVDHQEACRTARAPIVKPETDVE